MFEEITVVLGNIEGAPVGLLESFGVHWQLLLIQSLNFLGVVAILYFFAFKPVLKTMEERKSKIENGLRYAEEMRLQLERSDTVVRGRLTQAKEGAHQILEDAKQQAKIYSSKQKAEVERLTQGMVDAAKRNIAEEKTKMLRDLKGEMKALAVDVISKVLEKEMSAEERKRYLEGMEIKF